MSLPVNLMSTLILNGATQEMDAVQDKWNLFIKPNSLSEGQCKAEGTFNGKTLSLPLINKRPCN